ncbi:hypothetical protein BB560_001506 [Smittium megazygosporum]|uniref:4-nitrophenylphosphatase n=1 Tax=Smittium megazygosporum TaxID=133381 RepID=A0A2T9ZHG9_9FUNG|nr:hypothetical protein BB560_001506 [Smittium megazygosporum]
MHLTLNKECAFIATNEDSTFPLSGFTSPGAGALLSVLKTSTKKTPVVIGKPHKTLFECISAAYDLDKSRTIMVGDRLDTDIQFGINSGVDTLLVFTGVSSEDDARDEKHAQATFAISSFGEISKLA